MKKIILMIVALTIVFSMTACGNKGISETEKSEYVGGVKVVDLLDPASYEANGNKMVKALQGALEATPNDFHMLEQRSKGLANLFSGGNVFEETFKEEEREFYYVGDIKDGKPHGYGVITSGYKVDEMHILYIGEFNKGEVEGCYGMRIGLSAMSKIKVFYIQYEGIMSYLTNEDLHAVAADGKRIRLYDFDSVYLWHENADVEYESMGFSRVSVARCLPRYIGEIKNGEYHGEGISYYENGSVCYDGKFKAGRYHGEGKLYDRTGVLEKEGEFKRGELDDGKIYRE